MAHDEKAAAEGLIPWLSTLIAIAIATFFGLVRVMADYLVNEKALRWLVVIAKLVVSASIGLVTHWLCVEWHVSENLSAVAIAISGYGGAEVINAAKEAMIDFIRRKTQSASDPGSKS